MTMSRRRFLAGAAGVVGAAWLPVGRVHASADGSTPLGFPADVELFRQRFQCWSKEIVIDDLWTCRPTTSDQVMRIVNWAATAGWRVRARGAMHGWSPILVTAQTTAASKVVLVDTSGIAQVSAEPAGVRAGAGALLISVLTHLESRRLGLESVPAVGEITVGGMLAIGAHGAAIPAAGERSRPPANLGSLSHAVRELTAVVWDPAVRRYTLRTFSRSDSELAALACSLGRTFVTEVVLDASPLRHLRCRSYVHIPAAELFAAAGSPPGSRTLASFFEATGRAESLWYPFTDKPWLKVWEVAETQPLTSRRTTGPYNYPFSDQVPEPLADLARKIVTDNPESTPTFGQMTYAVTAAGLVSTASFDLWGPAKDTQLYIRASTLRVRELGLAVLTARRYVQETVHLLASEWQRLLTDYEARGHYPINMPLEIRASALDGALGTPPILTPTSPDPSSPDMNVVLYTNPLTLTGTPGSDAFLAEYERFVRTRVDQLGHARLRPEWSKHFACSIDGPGTDVSALASIRKEFRRGRTRPSSWDGAAATFDRLDPHSVFSNDFLDTLFSD